MTPQEILKQAVLKAIAKGWTDYYLIEPIDKAMEYALATNQWMTIIYRHDFAKALWPDQWQYHLQMMVVAEDPLQYLGEHI